jgi:hypothetical protein
MDRATFDKFKRDCRVGWEGLAKTGDVFKPAILTKHTMTCPACALVIQITSESKEFHGEISVNCRICPIDRWRKIANASSKSCDGTTDYSACACESLDPNGPFQRWKRHVLGSDERKGCAQEVADLRWTYLNIYKESGDGIDGN